MSKKEQYKFFAFLNRMKLINRWSLMHNRTLENVAQHSHQTAVLAHALGLIDKRVFNKTTDPDKCAVIALYHEVAEVLTGDAPTPVKYRSPDMIAAYKQAEKCAQERVLGELPAELKPFFTQALQPEPCRETELVRFADKIAAYIKCVEEVSAGNTEFLNAKKTTETAIQNFKDETVHYFMKRFAEAFSMNLDELME